MPVPVPTPRGARQHETENLSFSAYAHMRGLRVLKAQVYRKPGGVKYLFIFDDPDSLWDGLQIDWANSESQQYDASVRTLKKLCQRGEV